MFQTNVMLPVLPIDADPAHHAGGGASLLFRVRGEGRSPKGRQRAWGSWAEPRPQKGFSHSRGADGLSWNLLRDQGGGGHGPLKSADGFATHRQLAN